MSALSFDWSELGSVLLKLLGAYLLALPIGWEREREERSMGLRTFPLVATASTAYLLIAEELFTPDLNAQARVLQGLVTGIGFIGAGAILKLKEEETIYGTATAASVWATGALGAAMAYGRLEIALVITILTFGTLRWMTPVKEIVEDHAGNNDTRR
jgi:putative Mg2+ transporter-C (MgtC) family protein